MTNQEHEELASIPRGEVLLRSSIEGHPGHKPVVSFEVIKAIWLSNHCPMGKIYIHRSHRLWDYNWKDLPEVRDLHILHSVDFPNTEQYKVIEIHNIKKGHQMNLFPGPLAYKNIDEVVTDTVKVALQVYELSLEKSKGVPC
jgi:hypothetical protein